MTAEFKALRANSLQRMATQPAKAVVPNREPNLLLSEVSEQFIAAIEEGTALSKKGKPYKPETQKTLRNALRGRITEELGGFPIRDLRRGHLQTMVDEMVAEKLSGSRVHNVVNSVRSLYRYAIARDLAETTSHLTEVLLPAIDENPRNRIATPKEFIRLLAALQPDDAILFALAGYATARSKEILNLVWGAVEWTTKRLHLAEEEHYAKSEAARRPFPIVAPLASFLKTEWIRQGKPGPNQLVCPTRKETEKEGTRLSVSALYKRADDAWEKRELEPIRLQECRHTASSWMRAAGIDLKLRSVLMGHSRFSTTASDVTAASGCSRPSNMRRYTTTN